MVFLEHKQINAQLEAMPCYPCGLPEVSCHHRWWSRTGPLQGWHHLCAFLASLGCVMNRCGAAPCLGALNWRGCTWRVAGRRQGIMHQLRSEVTKMSIRKWGVGKRREELAWFWEKVAGWCLCLPRGPQCMWCHCQMPRPIRGLHSLGLLRIQPCHPPLTEQVGGSGLS